MDDAHLVMVGDGPLRGDLERAVSALGLTEHVTFAGHQKLPSSVFSRCPMGLLTSDVEGFPNVIPEMLASGVTHVVTTQCAGNLKEIPGVTVVPLTKSVVDDLAAATLAARDSVPAEGVERYVEQRTPAHYLSTVLGLASRER